MPQQIKQIFESDKEFNHKGTVIVYGWRGSEADGDLSIVGGAKVSATTFDAQIWFNFGADRFTDTSAAGLKAACVLPTQLFNEKLSELYGAFGEAPEASIFELLLQRVQLFYKSGTTYDPTVGLKLI